MWDTVSAYGGPFAELTRAIDNWIFPLSMPDYRLNVRVECARHALALDDERDAFLPLLWDELHEDRVTRHLKVREDRLQQVWFTGMHSDVGGGYPDESLSYVSLLWMMEEAEKAGLRTLQVIKDRFIALASSAGPIHDSRKGVASYYRYQPRRIAAWLDPVTPQTLGLRDPEITGAEGRPQGLLREVKVHQSVIARIAHGTDRYAPITLPPDFEVYPPQTEGENVPQADSVAGGAPRGPHAEPVGTPLARPMVSAALRTRLAETHNARVAAFEGVYDLVWRRRVTYFVTLGFTVLLATMPFWVGVRRSHLAGGRPHLDRRPAACPGTAAALGVCLLGEHLRRQPVLLPGARIAASGSGCGTARAASASFATARATSGRRARSTCRSSSRPRRAASPDSATRRATSAGCRCSSGACCPTSCSCRSSCSWRRGSPPPG